MRPIALALVSFALVVPALVHGEPPALAFGAPVKLNEVGWGYEPGIDVDAEGTLYVTAHKGSVLVEDDRLSSFLWYSKDQGQTWDEMPAPFQLYDKLYAFEGDVAVDDAGRVYFVDTHLADLTISRWSGGDSWDFTSPVVATAGGDDRPWISAHGDGIVYLASNTAQHLPAEGDLLSGKPADSGSIHFYRSTDAGVTWSLGHAFARAVACNIAASPVDDSSVAALCVIQTVDGKLDETAFVSHDRGASWTSTFLLRHQATPISMNSIAYDRAGNLYAAIIDALPTGSRLYLARFTDAWTVSDITPFPGTFRYVWTTARAAGTVGLGFYATSDNVPGATSEWFVHGAIGKGVDSATPQWSFTKADPVRVAQRAFAPPDFMTSAIGPDDALYLAYARDVPTDILHAPPPDFDQDIFVVRQAGTP